MGVETWKDAYALFGSGGIYEGMWGILDILRMAGDGDSMLALSGPSLSEGVNLGTFKFVDGELYLEQGDENTVLAMSMLASGEYDHTSLVHFVPFLQTTSYTATYIYMPAPHSTWRYDPSLVDPVNVALDFFGLGLSIFGAAAPVNAGRSARYAQGLSYGVGTVNAVDALANHDDWIGAGLSVAGSAPYPIVSIPASLVSLIRDVCTGFQP